MQQMKNNKTNKYLGLTKSSAIFKKKIKEKEIVRVLFY